MRRGYYLSFVPLVSRCDWLEIESVTGKKYRPGKWVVIECILVPEKRDLTHFVAKQLFRKPITARYYFYYRYV